MKLSYSQMIILFCLQQLAGERTPSSILHILNGKKSSQTIQDAHLFQLTSLFQTAPTCTRDEMERIIDELLQQQYIQITPENYYVVTKPGERKLAEMLQKEGIPSYVNGWRYHQVTTLFWERLSLLVQVCSHLVNNERSYIPIQRNDESKLWVKQFLQQSQYNRVELTEKLLDEMLHLLSLTTEIDPRTIVLRLTGRNKIGLTTEQAATVLRIEQWQYTYQFINVLHYLIFKSKENPRTYVLLSQLSEHPSLPLTQSTKKTYDLVNKGYTFEQIIETRHLKKGTIEDHFIEIVFTDEQFAIDHFVSTERQQAIMDAARHMSTRQLKLIKERVPDASYFEIRLTIAKHGDYKWN